MGMGFGGVMLTFAVPAISELRGAGNGPDLANGNKQTKKTVDIRNGIFWFFMISSPFVVLAAGAASAQAGSVCVICGLSDLNSTLETRPSTYHNFKAFRQSQKSILLCTG